MKGLILFLVIFVQSSRAGYFVSSDNFRGDFTVHQNVDSDFIVDYILKHNPGTGKENAYAISWEILHVSACLKIDTIFMLGLIHKESTFHLDARSRGGAAGLTQITGAALEEVRDQLGLSGKGHSRQSNTDYLQEQLPACMGQAEYGEFIKFLKKDLLPVKAELQKNPTYSLYLGAIALKVYLALVKDSRPAKEFKTKEDLLSVYQRALERYNGDDIQRIYARIILHYVDSITSQDPFYKDC